MSRKFTLLINLGLVTLGVLLGSFFAGVGFGLGWHFITAQTTYN